VRCSIKRVVPPPIARRARRGRALAECVELDLLDAYDATYGRGLATAMSED
jgi:hypothetical protein